MMQGPLISHSDTGVHDYRGQRSVSVTFTHITVNTSTATLPQSLLNAALNANLKRNTKLGTNQKKRANQEYREEDREPGVGAQ